MADLLRRSAAGIVALALCLAGAALLARAPSWLTGWQERVFDRMILAAPAPPVPVRVIDIGAADEDGRPWDRAASARLAQALAAAGPAVVAWDIVFAGNCGEDPANAALAAGLMAAPNVLGLLLSGQPGPAPAAPPLAVAESARPFLWSAPGAEAPCAGFAAAATLASAALPADDAARVRVVPAAVSAAGTVFPVLPVEALRRAGHLALPVISGGAEGLVLRSDRLVLPLETGATLRFRPRDAAARLARTLPAEAVVAGRLREGELKGAVVFVGSSLPQRGGLRPTAADPLYPSVQIAADLAEGLLAGALPHRPAMAPWAEAAALVLFGAGLAVAVLRLAPVAAVALAFGMGAVWAGGAFALHLATGLLADPAGPPAVLAGSALAAVVLRAARSARAERALRARMGQVLPGAVVTRLAENPHLLRLSGERRVVTALFTDLEGFSALTATMEPEALVACLDRYFSVVTAAVLRHGGMVDKIVGDAVHALFNAPLDQPGHVDAALSAAAEIVAATATLQTELGLGRTRVGVETGPAILGDVGSGARIDYTAHGPAVNLAARLQEAAKVLGPPVIIGPGAAAAAMQPLTALGLHEVRSFGRVAVYTLPDEALRPR
ncbi:adenylate/guanylate cyclase domain-containing protein [Neotabrizicola sp. VNH66]|uniref:adenylate/guanylate cyclase domain-containing protein n=1 Tax=Neotabrizicola sp. VNH66 TaxID=3400918 RepID=UPI003C0B0631